VIKWLLDRPDRDWPIALCAVCASIVGFLGFWFVAKVIRSVCGCRPTDCQDAPAEASGDCGRQRKGISVVGSAEHRVREMPATLRPVGTCEMKLSWQHPVAMVGRGLTHWAFVVACLYLLVLIAVTCPLIVLSWWPHAKMPQVAGIYLAWPYWIWVAVMFICQIALLVAPARALSRRPVTRRPLIVPLLVGGLMMIVLALGAYCTFFEMQVQFGTTSPFVPNTREVLVVACGIWAAWAVAFYRISCRRSVKDALLMQSYTLVTGSILELLVAIPTHILARRRNECCAGAGSFVGLTLGTSVMLFAFGPSVFFLFLARSRRLRPRQRSAGATSTDIADATTYRLS
jgi:hypothetical protein